MREPLIKDLIKANANENGVGSSLIDDGHPRTGWVIHDLEVHASHTSPFMRAVQIFESESYGFMDMDVRKATQEKAICHLGAGSKISVWPSPSSTTLHPSFEVHMDALELGTCEFTMVYVGE